MKEIKIFFTNDSYVHFKLLQNEFVEEWFSLFQKVQAVTSSKLKLNCSYTDKTYNEQKVNQCIDNLNTIFLKLEKILNTKFPVGPFTRNSITRDDCNKVHRIFTTLKESNGTTFDYSYPNLFKSPVSNAYNILVNEINDNIHYIEKIFYANSTFLQENPVTCGLLQFRRTPFVKINTKHYEFLNDSLDNDVILNSNILGKSFLNCFWDDDDPNNLDIKNEENYTANLEFILYETSYLKLLHHPKYLGWLDMHNVQKNNLTLGRMPIGKIVDKKLSDRGTLTTIKVEYA